MTTTENTTDVTGPDDTTPDNTAAVEPTDEGAPAEPDAGRDAARDAAKYRRQAREAEAERDTLRGRLETLQRAQVEAMAAQEGVQKPSALWASGSSLADCLGEDGQVDQPKAQRVIRQSVETLGLATGTAPSFDGGARTPPPTQRGWADLLSAKS